MTRNPLEPYPDSFFTCAARFLPSSSPWMPAGLLLLPYPAATMSRCLVATTTQRGHCLPRNQAACKGPWFWWWERPPYSKMPNTKKAGSYGGKPPISRGWGDRPVMGRRFWFTAVLHALHRIRESHGKTHEFHGKILGFYCIKTKKKKPNKVSCFSSHGKTVFNINYSGSHMPNWPTIS
jgi:hypothetical protein